MKVARLILLTAISAAWAFFASESHAQQGGGPPVDTTMRPAVSPYMNLTGRNQFGISPYQTLVLPQIQQQQINANQRAAVARLQAEVNTNSGQVNTQVNPGVRPTGKTRGGAPVYGNFSHFFPSRK